MSQWQPIETAPIGDFILIYGEDAGEPRVYAAFYDDDDWFDSEASSKSLTSFGWFPTHWMPLPDPPKT